MAVREYRWPAVDEFRDRADELARLERWWSSGDRDPLSLYGRRRVGKSWLFRRFAHGKPAVILVADRVAPGQQLSRMAAQLEGTLGFRPVVEDPAALIALLYRLAESEKVLAVIDEFPYLLGTTSAEQQRHLTSIQAAIEQVRDQSRIKLLMAGSTIAQMEALQAERSPLHGRLQPLQLRPLTFAASTELMRVAGSGAQVQRYAIAGGMPRYLSALSGTDLAGVLTHQVVDRQSQLFNEPRTVLQTELREPAVYFSILAALAGNPQDVSSIAGSTGLSSNELSSYLTNLESLQLVARSRPVGAGGKFRGVRWVCSDDFVRFWFRFVQPFQGELEAGADPSAYVRATILPALPGFTAPVFERLARDWVRVWLRGQAHEVGPWWGPSLHAQRRAKTRFSEEVDAVALRGRRVLAVAEAKWTAGKFPASAYTDLRTHKLPALAQAGFDVAAANVVLVARSGFGERLRQETATVGNVTLLTADRLVQGLLAGA